jgi:hypothetical protein
LDFGFGIADWGNAHEVSVPSDFGFWILDLGLRIALQKRARSKRAIRFRILDFGFWIGDSCIKDTPGPVTGKSRSILNLGFVALDATGPGDQYPKIRNSTGQFFVAANGGQVDLKPMTIRIISLDERM